MSEMLRHSCEIFRYCKLKLNFENQNFEGAATVETQYNMFIDKK